MSKKKTELAVIEPSEYAAIKLGDGEMKGLIEANCAGGVDRFDMDRVTMPTGGGLQFAVPNIEGGEDMLDEIVGVCVLFKDERKMWHESYDEGNVGSPPDCSSSDMITGIGDPGGYCPACPLSKFGSGKGNSQKCSQSRLLFVMRSDNLLPLIVALSPTSLKMARRYFLRLTTHGVPYYQAVTRLTLEKDKNAEGKVYSKVNLGMIKKIDGDEAGAFTELHNVFSETFSKPPVPQAVTQEAVELSTSEDETQPF